MNILILGSGGREHAIAWKISQSNKLTKLFVAPGNAGTQEIGENFALGSSDFEMIKKFIIDNNIHMLIIGPEDPLVNGLVDYLQSIDSLTDLRIIGPDREGARLEGSKDYAKEFMNKYNIPTAAYKSFEKSNITEAYNFLDELNPPYVLKADGLAAGKGVIIEQDITKAKTALKQMLDGQFGEASKKVVIEEFLDGIEYSVFVLTDSKNYLILPEAKDYKRIGEGNTGLNTGGMGAISPVPFFDDNLRKKTVERIIEPTIDGLKSENIDFKGFIFFGLINVNGNPYVIEYNVRLGDPETEAILPRIENDLLELFESCATESLNNQVVKINPQTVTTVMTVSGGYPESYEKGKLITGLDKVNESIIFHAGTKAEGNKIVSNGGRVLAISSFGNNMQDALNKSYNSIKKIKFDKMYYRTDIGFDL